MPFLTQGKTNWKYILIIVILAILVGGGILWRVKREKITSIELPEIKKQEGVVDYLTKFPELKEFVEKAVEETCEKLSGWDKGDCYVNLAIKTGDEVFCEKSQTPGTALREMCYADLARLKNDSSLCEKAGPDSSICSDYFKREEELVCEKLPSLNERDKCYSVLAVERKDEILCGKILAPKAPEVRAGCYLGLADLKNDPSICLKVETASLASSCWEYFGMKDWKTYRNEEYGFEIKYPKDWIPYKNILGAFDIYKSFYDYNCSIEVYANTERYLYPIEEAEGYFQPFSESKISTREEVAFIGDISGKKLSSPELGGREIYFFEKEVRDNDYYFNIFLDVYKQDPHGEPIIKENKCKDVFKEILFTFQFTKEKITDDLITEPICKYRQGEYEMRFYDTQGRMTGIKEGEIKEEIPGSYYIPRDLNSPLDCPPNCYEIGIPDYIPIHKIEFFCIKEGNYELSASASTLEKPASFSAINIPIISGLTHVYIFDWELLARDEEGVVIFIDLDGDGIFEKSITSDKELTCEEFIIQLKKR